MAFIKRIGYFSIAFEDTFFIEKYLEYDYHAKNTPKTVNKNRQLTVYKLISDYSCAADRTRTYTSHNTRS
jgi:hypothetical protein